MDQRTLSLITQTPKILPVERPNLCSLRNRWTKFGAYPTQAFTHDVSRYLVISVKLSEGHIVPTGLQVSGDPATTSIDRQDVVSRSMRDEEARLSLRRPVDDESG